MPARWNKNIEKSKYKELSDLYITQNKTISEIGKILKISESTVYDRLLRLRIKPNRSIKKGFNNTSSATIPYIRTRKLSEFFGIMLGDGCLTKTQVTVTLGNKETEYVDYVSKLITELFNIRPKVIKTKKGHYVVYFGSTKVVNWLLENGLVFNKVRQQVKPPSWIFEKRFRIEGFLKGIFDTDGSIYKLRFGVQIAFTNRSLPLLGAILRSLHILNYHPSKISMFRVYVTKRKYVLKFIKKIGFSNPKHRQRALKFVKYYKLDN